MIVVVIFIFFNLNFMNLKKTNQRYDPEGNPIKFYDEDGDYWNFPVIMENGGFKWEGSSKES